MLQRVVRTICTVGLGYSLAILPVVGAADDSPAKPAKEATSSRIDWSAYKTIGDVVGEVVKANDRQITIRVTWYETKVSGGGGNRRPPLSSNPRNFRNPYGSSRGRSSQPRVQVKEQHHDYELEFVPESLVRTKKLPPKFDDKGKRADYTASEIEALRAPDGAPAYAASASDLLPGTIVEVILIRDKSILATKATEGDLRVKYAIILGKDPNGPKDVPAKDNKKGKKN
jgi:hypothetical protein